MRSEVASFLAVLLANSAQNGRADQTSLRHHAGRTELNVHDSFPTQDADFFNSLQGHFSEIRGFLALGIGGTLKSPVVQMYRSSILRIN
jgi:hypothetical protein